MEFTDLSSFQLDVLQEVGNIGTGNAATALSQLLNKKIDMSVPSINIISFDDIFTKMDGDKVVMGVIVRVLGDTPGNILFILDKDAAFDMIKDLTGLEEDHLTQMGGSVIAEVGNIIASSFMNAISRLTKLTMIASVPAVSYDMLGAILSTTFIESSQFDEYILDIETTYTKDGKEMGGHFYYIPKPGSLEKILTALGVI